MVWPIIADVTPKLTAKGITPPSDTELQAIIDGAILEWESFTNYRPFLAESVDSTRLFDPPAWRTGNPRQLDLRSGYISITSVTISKVDGSGGTVLAEDSTGYSLWPQDAPYRLLNFNYPIEGLAQSIEVVGKRGYSDSIPADAYVALLDLVIARVGADAVGGDLSKLKQGPVEMTYNQSAIARAESRFKLVAQGYQRRTF